MPTAVVHTLINSQRDLPHTAPRLGAAIQVMARTLQLWHRRHRERHALPVLDERELRDLRLSRWEVERELAKPFWRG
jgi:uncharacterized protein YjiS (DUF1127 family)